MTRFELFKLFLYIKIKIFIDFLEAKSGVIYWTNTQTYLFMRKLCRTLSGLITLDLTKIKSKFANPVSFFLNSPKLFRYYT
mgnify:CR=1 FL=1